MQKNDRVIFQGRPGTIVGFMPAGMVDVRFDDSQSRVERRQAKQLSPLRSNPRRGAKARPNPPEWKAYSEEDVPFYTRVSRSVAATETAKRFVVKNEYGKEVDEVGNVLPRNSEWVLVKLPNRQMPPSRELSADELEDAELKRESEFAARLERQPKLSPEELAQAAGQRLADTTKEVRKVAGITRRSEESARTRTKARSLYDQIRGPGIGLFTRPDPPRLSKDFSKLCGNPIDGTAYFVVVDDAKSSVTRFVRTQDVLAAASRSKETNLALFFDQTYKPLMESEGYRIYPQAESTGKKLRVGGQKAKVQVDAPSELDFFTKGEDGRKVYWKMTYSEAQERSKLRDQLQPFAPRSFVTTSAGPLLDQIKANLSVHELTAAAFIRCGGVSSDKLALFDPNRSIPLGTRIQIGLADKANDPFFSWVSSIVPASLKGGRLPPCLSDEEMALQSRFRAAEGVLMKLRSSYVGILGLYQRDDPEGIKVEKHVGWKVRSLAAALASMYRWFTRLDDAAKSEDPTAIATLELLGGSAGNGMWKPGPLRFYKEDGTVNEYSPLISAMQYALNKSDSLITEVSGDKLFASAVDTTEDFRSFMRSLRHEAISESKTVALTFAALEGQEGVLLAEGVAHYLAEDDRAFREGYKGLRKNWLDTGEVKWRYEANDYVHRHMTERIRSGDRSDAAELALVVSSVITDIEEAKEQADSAVSVLRIAESTKEPNVAARREQAHRLVQMAKDKYQLAEEMILLAWLYHKLQGPILVGPLMLLPPKADTFTRARNLLAKASTDMMGGERGLGSTDSYTVFKTYNPVLFQATRLFWQTKTQKPYMTWGRGLLDQPDLIGQIDDVGRYAVALANTQDIAIRQTSVEGVSYGLYSIVSEALKLANGKPEEVRSLVLDRRSSAYKEFRLLWPFGATVDDAVQEIQNWISDPVGYLSETEMGRSALKARADQAFIAAGELARKGIGGAGAPKPDVPYVLKGVDVAPLPTGGYATKSYDNYPGSIIAQLEGAQDERKQIEKAIDSVLAQISRRKE